MPTSQSSWPRVDGVCTVRAETGERLGNAEPGESVALWLPPAELRVHQ